jgi:hypothetical protein
MTQPVGREKKEFICWSEVNEMLKQNRRTVDMSKSRKKYDKRKAKRWRRIEMFFQAKEREKKSMFHIERGIDWKWGNA